MPRVEPLPPLPPVLTSPDGGLATGLWAGNLTTDPVAHGSARGRVRRWSYAAAGDARVQLGVAVVDLGPVAAAFAWCWDGQRLHRWERKGLGGRHARVGATPDVPAWFVRGASSVEVAADGTFAVDVPVEGGRLHARIDVAPTTAAVLSTRTPGGGWNVTRKAAGEPATGVVKVAGVTHRLDGASWRDWTSGRQDRRTVWRWAAGAGRDDEHRRRVGLNASTGMNGTRPGENVVWWDGIPYPLALSHLEPVADGAAGRWRLAGEGWDLRFEPVAVRAATENLLVVRSRYVQPIGSFRGTLPGPDGAPIAVTIHGVTEDHAATW